MSGFSDSLGVISSIGSEYLLDGLCLTSNSRHRGGGDRVRLGERVGGMDRRVDWLHWDNRDGRSHRGDREDWGGNPETDGRGVRGSGTCLV